MLEAEVLVCSDCGNVHMEGAVGPDHIESCVVCDGDVDDVDPGDLIGL